MAAPVYHIHWTVITVQQVSHSLDRVNGDKDFMAATMQSHIQDKCKLLCVKYESFISLSFSLTLYSILTQTSPLPPKRTFLTVQVLQKLIDMLYESYPVGFDANNN